MKARTEIVICLTAMAWSAGLSERHPETPASSDAGPNAAADVAVPDEPVTDEALGDAEENSPPVPSDTDLADRTGPASCGASARHLTAQKKRTTGSGPAAAMRSLSTNTELVTSSASVVTAPLAR